MNIKELVLVISILLSIRIAEYAMKKYKEQKDVEVTKKQKSRKQTKKYIITAPSILKVGLPCGIFFGCTTIAFILSQIFKWEFVQQIENCYFIGGISSGTSTLVGESLETMTGTNKRGIEQIGLDVLEDLILGGILGGIGSKIKIKGLNAGRNNYQAIFAGGITRLVNGTGAMHLKTLLKGYIAQLVESIRDILL